MTMKTLQPTERRRHVVAFRLTDAEYLELFPFFEAFGSTTVALRWLLSQEQVQDVMESAVTQADG
jgi:hypothetical protein